LRSLVAILFDGMMQVPTFTRRKSIDDDGASFEKRVYDQDISGRTVPTLLTRRKCIDDGGDESFKKRIYDLDISGRTVDVDESNRSVDLDYSFTRRPSLGGSHLRGCMKVKTQLESIARTPYSPHISFPHMSSSSDAAGGPSLRPLKEHNLRFGTVEFRHYYCILGDSPSTSSGPPIGIGWSYDPKHTIMVNLEEYEQGSIGIRRAKHELKIPSHVRETMLREVGYSRRDLKAAVDINRKEMTRRMTSIQQQKLDHVREGVETMKHGVRRIIPRLRYRSREEESFHQTKVQSKFMYIQDQWYIELIQDDSLVMYKIF
jgi:hypothetical protein